MAAVPGFGAGVRVAWDGGRVASGPGWFPPCNQGEFLEVWHPASTITTAVSHASAQKRKGKEREPVIVGFNVSFQGGQGGLPFRKRPRIEA